MAEQIRGILIEGQSCAGKTSLFNALKRHCLSNPNFERNVLFLAEHYSQNLNDVNGELKRMTRAQNLNVLSDRLSMLEHLNDYADSMGISSRRSRGLFFVFERFHLNFAGCFNAVGDPDYKDIEKRIHHLNGRAVLWTIGARHIRQRLEHRSLYTHEEVTDQTVAEYAARQEYLIEITKKSSVPCTILNTDDMDWDGYAAQILDNIE